MRIDKIRRMIDDAISDEEQTGRLADTIEQLARQNGMEPNDQALRDVVDFIRGYIEHVPLYLEQGAAGANQFGLSAEMGQMLGELETYWFKVDDIIPDHLGLIGLCDDAFASLLLLQSLSDYCQATIGQPLLQQNLTHANQLMRQVIGEPAASLLEQQVGITMANAMMQRLVGQVAGAGFMFGFGDAPDPIWGNASVDEIVDTKLGAMGIGI